MAGDSPSSAPAAPPDAAVSGIRPPSVILASILAHHRLHGSTRNHLDPISSNCVTCGAGEGSRVNKTRFLLSE